MLQCIGLIEQPKSKEFVRFAGKDILIVYALWQQSIWLYLRTAVE